MPDTVITVDNLSKKFCRSLKRSMLYGSLDTARAMLGLPTPAEQLRPAEFWALDRVSFEVKRGETVGLIGINGSGKSTLLRLLTGIFPPDNGHIAIEGRIGSLIAVGAGFHPHMTGRENIYLNGTILGMSKADLVANFKRIVDFAEIGDFLDAPVSTYSSGMRVRLGFAIAAHCNPDILLVDEVLSVGDIGFRNKSLRHMYEFKKAGNSVVFVSHQIEQVRQLCDRVIILHRGQVVYDGPSYEGCIQYEESNRTHRLQQIRKEFLGSTEDEEYEFRESDGGDISFREMGILGAEDKPTDEVSLDGPLVFYCDFAVERPLGSLCFSVGIHNDRPDPLIWLMSNDADRIAVGDLSPGEYRLRVVIPQHHLVPGVYMPRVAIRNEGSGVTYERAWSRSVFRVRATRPMRERGVICVDEQWDLRSRP